MRDGELERSPQLPGFAAFDLKSGHAGARHKNLPRRTRPAGFHLDRLRHVKRPGQILSAQRRCWSRAHATEPSGPRDGKS